MLSNAVPENRQVTKPGQLKSSRDKIASAQENIYAFLLEIVNTWSPEAVLLEFKNLFIHHVESVNSDVFTSVYDIVFANDEAEFRNTIKRCCYILVNNWDTRRHYKATKELIQLFSDATLGRYTLSPTLKRLRKWIENFTKSSDFEELKLFAARHEEYKHWSQRYTSFLLVPQYVDISNPVEQREAARTLSKQLKERFKFDLAMYVARSQLSHLPLGKPNSAIAKVKIAKNPTVLGDQVLNLIKMILVKRGTYSYTNLANLFLQQTQAVTYKQFKKSLQNYLVFSVDNPVFVQTLKEKLAEKLDDLYEDYNEEPLNNALLLRTCNRVIEYLTTENHQEPSVLFLLLLSKGNSLTLAIVLLKLILVSRNSRSHLEVQIAQLIKYYEDCTETDCQWVIQFLEILNVTFAVYTENVEYNLIKMGDGLASTCEPSLPPLERYRIFSQLRRQALLQDSSELSTTETASPEAAQLEETEETPLQLQQV